MRTITAGQLRARLGETLDLASSGERIIVERDHRQVAAIVPIEDAQRIDGHGVEATRRRQAAMARIRARAARMKQVESARGSEERDAESGVRWDRDHGHEDGE